MRSHLGALRSLNEQVLRYTYHGYTYYGYSYYGCADRGSTYHGKCCTSKPARLTLSLTLTPTPNPNQVLHEQACTHMLSLIVSNLWEFDTALAGDGSSRSSTNVLLPSAIEDFDLPARLTDIIELLKASPSAKHHVRIESALELGVGLA